MIYELRIYGALPGRLPAPLARFENHTAETGGRTVAPDQVIAPTLPDIAEGDDQPG